MEKNKTYSEDNTALKNKLINQKDYMDVKKELDILKGIAETFEVRKKIKTIFK